ncbi:sensor histidine kinase [Caldicellulosiruptor naganoensis]|uniref:histidine kinase n=1 Tax=Caldicellulosiruptor naganoensis TaxID=29324 RepID=A0ABY7BKK0_9FIRM|nr:HAMP domain-containing sensor histidine kinase [Caldicellulosiruptor naganoensis]WAM32417.1 HAMP domain-containing histidine kinase [Caldicellulosiruptor naganoensis]
MKIRTKIYLSYLGIIVFIFVIFSIVFYISFRNNLIEQVKTDNLRFAKLVEYFFINQSKDVKELRNFEAYFEPFSYKFLQDYIVIISSDGAIEYSNKNLSVEARVKIMSLFDENKESSYSFEIGWLHEKPFLFTFYRSKLNTEFIVLLISDLERISIFQKRFFSLILQIAIFTAILAAAVSIFVSKQITQGLLKLKEGIIEASKMRFNKKVEVTSKDEIGMIAREFNKLIEKISEYNQAQIRFLQNISHELKTPLTSIRGYAEVLKMGLLDTKKAEYAADKVIEHVDRLKLLINQIIDLTKIELVENYFMFEKAIIEDVVFDAILNNEGYALSKKIEIIFEPTTQIPVLCDREKLKEAFSNIISNCVRYAKNKVMIKIETQKDEFEVIIEDDGEGFKSDEVDKIFERFYKGKRGESGLGLSIAKAIFEKHGFSVEAKSGTPTGAKFIIKGKLYKEQ